MIVHEFKGVRDVNYFLSECKNNIEIIPITRTFTDPIIKDKIVNIVNYIIIEYDEVFK